jgi:hypothetical protein
MRALSGLVAGCMLEGCVASVWQVPATHQVVESGIRSQRIEDRPKQDGRIEASFLCPAQPEHCLVRVAKSDIGRGDPGVRRCILRLAIFQIPDDTHCLLRPPRYGIGVGQAGFDGGAIGQLDGSAKFRYPSAKRGRNAITGGSILDQKSGQFYTEFDNWRVRA